MDVRCPNCETEYELDESRLRPGGVTVKCASCQHVFRVRKRSDTDTGVAPAPSQPKLTPKIEDEERSWLIRMQDGEIKVCRELATLQRWIVSGTVTKECEISRTGKKWKPLSELKELTSFFAIAEEARDVAAGRRAAPVPPAPAVDGSVVIRQAPSASHPHTVPRDPAPVSNGPRPVSAAFNEDETVQLSDVEAQRPYTQTEEETIEMTREEAQAAIEAARLGYNQADPPTPSVVANIVPAHALANPASTMLSSSPPPPRPGGSSSSAPVAKRSAEKSVPPPAPGSRARTESQGSGPTRPREKTQPPPIPHARDSSERAADASWVKEGGKPKVQPGERSGPTGGLAKGVPTADAAFAGSHVSPDKVKSEEFKDGRFVASDERGIYETLPPPRGSGFGKWIVLISLLIIGGAGAALYIVLFKDGNKQSTAIAEASLDAGALQVTPPDAHQAGEIDEPAGDDLVASLDAAIALHDGVQLAGLLADFEASEPGLERSLSMARIHAAMAQHLLDAAVLAPQDAKKLTRASKASGKLSLASADEALGFQAESALALVIKADALRLTGSPSREVERMLKKASSDASVKSEEAYVNGMLRLRDQRVLDARKIFEALQSTASTPRVLYRLALVAFSEQEYEAANEIVQQILGLLATHAQAEELQARIAAKLDVGGPTDGVNDTNNTTNNTNTATNTNTGPKDPPSGESYDRILDRADKLAETGNCGAAIKLYEKAIDDNPSGVEALTGLGYCHLDAKNFSSAQARFRAALGISSRYQDALWGVAEGYQQQGLTDQAITAYRKFIEEHPTSRRAEMAKRQIERLGGEVKPAGAGDGNGGSPDPGAGDTAPAPPAPTPAPPAPTPAPPAPTPASPAPASGDGSGFDE